MFKKAHLDNGIPVLMETFRNVRSISLGLWVKVGSRHEADSQSGISHFLEHMFFKGTRKRSTKDIAIEIDSLGADLNAFTSRESTTFYIKVIDDFLPNGIELLSDIFMNSTFPEEEIEKEKKIIREEIKMVEDTPDDYIFDLFNETVWGDTGIGQSILGKRETIVSYTRDDLVKHVKKYYGVRDIVISCAGNFDPEQLLPLLNNHFGSLRRGSEPKRGQSPMFRKEVKVFSRELSEAHVCMGVPGLPQAGEGRYALSILNTILGGGYSSRLFQDIREKRGLAYSIYSFTSSYYDTGLWGVYAGVSRKKIKEVVDLIAHEMIALPETLTEPELDRAKKHLKGSVILALESTSSRMNNLARNEIYFGRHVSSEEIIRHLDSVSLSQIRELASRLIRKDLISIVAYGNIDKDILSPEI